MLEERAPGQEAVELGRVEGPPEAGPQDEVLGPGDDRGRVDLEEAEVAHDLDDPRGSIRIELPAHHRDLAGALESQLHARTVAGRTPSRTGLVLRFGDP